MVLLTELNLRIELSGSIRQDLGFSEDRAKSKTNVKSISIETTSKWRTQLL